MGRFLRVYVVDLAKPLEAVGLGDGKLRRMTETRFAKEFERVDGDPCRDEGAPTMGEAVHAVINGGPFLERYSYRYADAFEKICAFYAEFSDSKGPYHGAWLAMVDERLGQLGVDLGLTVFEWMYPAPLSNDEGGYGEWSHSYCVQMCEQWDALTRDQLAVLDSNTREWAEAAITWAREAAESPGRGVAGFFSI
ncbi:hypothetical protein ABZ319_30510 [Nocardia sp. NPDC005978]|uniref:DUF7691 family protein n=1 Tax=Nocardia sp. NPDC005978 TaxID=3156725 RepID=UPI0033BF608C